MRNMIFDVQSWPKKGNPGVTIVKDEHTIEDGSTSIVEMGRLTKMRGAEGYTAHITVSDEEHALPSLFKTRSQAGHAVRAAFEADIREKKATLRAERAVASANRKAARSAAKLAGDLGGEAA